MPFVSDRLYNVYLRPKMPTFATKVKVREIMIHLPCLTLHDRETIEAKRETNGNFDSMVILLDCLKRRENWPQQFIDALEACEHTTLAAEMRAEYDALRGVNNSSSSSPSATVVRAHVHPAPPAGPPSVPEGGANSQVAAAAAAPPAEESPPPQPAPQAQLPEADSPPEPVTEQAAEVEEAARPSTPPKSPEPPQPEAPATPPQREVNGPQEPEENSESDIKDLPGDNGVIPDRDSVENGETSEGRVSAPPLGRCETGTPSHPDPVQTTTTYAEVGPPTSPSRTQMDSDVTDGSSFFAVTPDRPPVQDTGAHVDLKPAVFERAATQVVESNHGTEVAAATPPLPGAHGIDAAFHDDDNDVCLSKPGQLLSIHMPNIGRPTGPAPAPPLEPYSGDSGRLEFSNAPTEPSAACRENGVHVRPNEPEENHYEGRSSEGSEVMTHVVRVSQEASILNLDGQSPAPDRVANGEAAEEVTSAPFACTAGKSSGPAGISPQLKTPQDSEKKTADHAKYIVAAAGVAACALLLAWRFKN